MIEKTAMGTGLIMSKDGKELIGAADYTLWIQMKSVLSEPSVWGGELVTMRRIRAGEYILELEPNDGRQGIIKLQPGRLRSIKGFKTYHYIFEGEGPLVREGSNPFID